MNEQLIYLIKELGGCNDMGIRPDEEWPTELEGYDIEELNEQASRIPEELVSIFVDGDVMEAISITDMYDCQELHDFLDDIFDGDLTPLFYYD